MIGQFWLQFLASFRILERTIAESANWKLSLAEVLSGKKPPVPTAYCVLKDIGRVKQEQIKASD